MAAGVGNSAFSGAIAAATERSRATALVATEQTGQLFLRVTDTVEQLTTENAALQARIAALESIHEHEVRAFQSEREAQQSAMQEQADRIQQLSRILTAAQEQSARDQAALLAQQQALVSKPRVPRKGR